MGIDLDDRNVQPDSFSAINMHQINTATQMIKQIGMGCETIKKSVIVNDSFTNDSVFLNKSPKWISQY